MATRAPMASSTEAGDAAARRPDATVGLLFLLGGLGFLYGLISVLDPLL